MRDADDLTWYLTHGISYFERSPFGATLDLLESRSYGSQPCHCCWGAGVVSTPIEIKVKRQQVSAQPGDWCPKCNGTGALPIRFCASYANEVALMHVSSAHQFGGKDAPDDYTLRLYAIVSRRLGLMQPSQRAALEAAYGDAGEALASGVRGRAWACSPLTDAGHELLLFARRSRDRNPDWCSSEDPVALITAVAQMDQSHPIASRTALLAQAAGRAIVILQEAEAAWENLDPYRAATKHPNAGPWMASLRSSPSGR